MPTSSAATASPVASGVTCVERAVDEQPDGEEQERDRNGGQLPALLAGDSRRARPPGGERQEQHRGGPRRVDQGARDVAADGRLVDVDRVAQSAGREAGADQQPAAIGPPGRGGERGDDEGEQDEVAERVGEVDGDRGGVPGAGVEHRLEHQRDAESGHAEATDHAHQPVAAPGRARLGAQQQDDADVERDVAEEVDAVGDGGIRRRVDMIEPQGPHEVAGEPGDEPGAQPQPGAARPAMAQRAGDADHDPRQLDRGVDPVGEDAVDAGPVRSHQGVRRMQRQEHPTGDEEHGERTRPSDALRCWGSGGQSGSGSSQ